MTLDLAKTDLAAEVRGRPALVSLWASWCEACVDEFPALNRLESFAREHNAIVVGVAVGDTRDVVRSVTQKNQLAYTQLIDQEFKLADALGQRNVPATLVIDRDGRIIFVGGALDERALEAFRRAIAAATKS